MAQNNTEENGIASDAKAIDCFASDPNIKKLLAAHLYRLAELSFETEKERERKLEDLSVQLLTCITILSVAFLTPASFLFECYADPSKAGIAPGQIRLAWMYAIVLAPLAVCLILTLHARMLKQMEVLDSPESQSRFVEGLYSNRADKSTDPVIDDLTLASNYCAAIQGTFDGMREKHNNMWNIIKLSIRLVIFSCSAALAFSLFLLIELT